MTDRKTNPIIKIANKSDTKIILRKKNLLEKLNERKLEYKENSDGICDTYIKFGLSNIDDVIIKLEKRDNLRSKRLTELLKKLRDENETYDSNISYYNDYVQKGGDLDYHVQEGIIEWFYLHKTKYKKYLKSTKDEDIAQAKALNEYLKKNGPDKYTERIKKSEMTFQLFL